MRSFNVKKVHILRIDRGDEVISTIEQVCKDNGIGAAVISGLGFLSKAEIAIFNPEKERYDTFNVNDQMELASLTGNISLKDGKPFAHIHVVLGNRNRIVAGHLVKGYVGGTTEIAIFELEGELLRNIKSGGLTILNV